MGDGVRHSVDTPAVGTAEEVEVVGIDEERLPEGGLAWLEKKTMRVANPTELFLQNTALLRSDLWGRCL